MTARYIASGFRLCTEEICKFAVEMADWYENFREAAGDLIVKIRESGLAESEDKNSTAAGA